MEKRQGQLFEWLRSNGKRLSVVIIDNSYAVKSGMEASSELEVYS